MLTVLLALYERHDVMDLQRPMPRYCLVLPEAPDLLPANDAVVVLSARYKARVFGQCWSADLKGVTIMLKTSFTEELMGQLLAAGWKPADPTFTG